MSKCLVILSGGQDSTTTLFWAKRNFDEVHAITFNYGQKHARELQAAVRVAEMAGVKTHEIVDTPGILKGRSPLTNPDERLETYKSASEMEEVIGDRVELTFVPMRNALFMVLAANRAICEDITDLVTGVCQEDNANYPDCRQGYVWNAENFIATALGLDRLGQRFTIHTPLMTLSKAETCWMAYSMPDCWEALAHTHTAYSGEYPPVTQDHATVLRAAGFEKAGLPDPLILRAFNEGLMDLPATPNYDEARRA